MPAIANKYRLSFTSGGMFLQESVQAIRLFGREQNWSSVREMLVDQQVISYKTISSARRLSREIVLRLGSLRESEINFFSNADFEERRAILWIAICRTYGIIPEFVRSVLTERLLSMRVDLSPRDFAGFLEDQALIHDEVANLKSATRTKLRTVLYRMLGEAGFYNKIDGLKKAHLPVSVRHVIDSSSPLEIAFFPGYEL